LVLGQGASLDGIPLTAIGGDAISIRGVSSPYISPNDLLVGIESAQAVGLQASGIIPELPIARGVQTLTLRVALAERDGRAAVAVATIHV
jgi:hypothetical protein